MLLFFLTARYGVTTVTTTGVTTVTDRHLHRDHRPRVDGLTLRDDEDICNDDLEMFFNGRTNGQLHTDLRERQS